MSIREPRHLEHLTDIVTRNREAHARYDRLDMVITNDAFMLVLNGGNTRP